MGWFNPVENLSEKAEETLETLANAASSEASGVADVLNTIASNSTEQASDEHLICCAGEIRDAAQFFIDALTGNDKKPLPFNNEELLVFLEAARIALSDAGTYEDIAEQMDLSDEELFPLRERLQNYLETGRRYES